MGAKTSIAESVESLFCFTKIQNQMFWFVLFFYSKGIKRFCFITKNERNVVCVLCPRDMSFFTEVKNNISFFLLKDTN